MKKKKRRGLKKKSSQIKNNSLRHCRGEEGRSNVHLWETGVEQYYNRAVDLYIEREDKCLATNEYSTE